MKIYTVENIDQLINVVEEIFYETKSRWWFRGQKEKSWGLLPHIRRGYTRQQERFLTNLFYTRARVRYSNCPNDSDYGAWLALMQHYGLPTRLLDWTESPLVAAYFAIGFSFDIDRTNFSINDDAAIWVLNPTRLNESQGYEPVFPPLNAISVEPLVRPAIKMGDESDEIQVLAVSPLETDLRMFVARRVYYSHYGFAS